MDAGFSVLHPEVASSVERLEGQRGSTGKKSVRELFRKLNLCFIILLWLASAAGRAPPWRSSRSQLEGRSLVAAGSSYDSFFDLF